MARVTSCPDMRDLMRLALGQVAPAELKAMGDHLLSCQACVGTLHGLKATDTVIQQLQSMSVDASSRELLTSVIRRLSLAPAGKAPDSPTVDSRVGESVANTEPLDFLQPPVEKDELGRLGPYRILRVLGAGGMGIVFQAEDSHLQRLVALKVMKPGFGGDMGARARFLREARAAAALKHDHIVTIYQVGQENDVPYLAMEFLEGEALEERLSRDGKLPLADVVRIGRELAEGLAAAHARQLIHRDIKPANIWLEKGSQRVKLLDFGLARPTDQRGNLTQTGLIVGTPEYMAPEQAAGLLVDARCDLYSLGCVLFHMAAGRLPFQGNSTMAILTALAVKKPPLLSELDPTLPPELIDLVDQLLLKEPAQRPKDAGEVLEVLRALEQGTAPPPARSSISVYRGRRRGLSRRAWLGGAAALLAGGGLGTLAWNRWGGAKPATGFTGPDLRVGVLHSQSGTMADSELPVVDAVMLAIEEINEAGGLLGRRLVGVLRDGQSDSDAFARHAEELITQEKVSTIFGCWTSASRKTIRPIIEKHNHLLVYPVQYEGLEQSPNIVYLGAAPNQQILPAVKYVHSFLNKRKFFLAGSDYVFPRTANAIIRDEVQALGGEVVGEEYLLLGDADVGGLVDKIKTTQPQVILNTLNGDSNRPFFRALRHAGITPEKTPTVSFSIAEQELRSLNIKDMVGDYAAWNYFQSIDRPENKAFVERFQHKYGQQRVISDPMEAAYCGVQLWARAVREGGSAEVELIRESIRGKLYDAPEGIIQIDPDNLHTWKLFRLGQITPQGQFQIIWQSAQPIKPEPYPPSRTRQAWETHLRDLYGKWGNRWHNPG